MPTFSEWDGGIQLSAPNALINPRNIDKQIGYILHEERRGEERRDKNMPPLHHQTYNWKQMTTYYKLLVAGGWPVHTHQ
jgi:hypothetical protein